MDKTSFSGPQDEHPQETDQETIVIGNRWSAIGVIAVYIRSSSPQGSVA